MDGQEGGESGLFDSSAKARPCARIAPLGGAALLHASQRGQQSGMVRRDHVWRFEVPGALGAPESGSGRRLGHNVHLGGTWGMGIYADLPIRHRLSASHHVRGLGTYMALGPGGTYPEGAERL